MLELLPPDSNYAVEVRLLKINRLAEKLSQPLGKYQLADGAALVEESSAALALIALLWSKRS